MDKSECITWLKILRANMNTFPEVSVGKKTEALTMAIKALEQEPRKGHWINNHNGTFECDRCGCKHSKSKWCPNCGARMFEPQESEDEE